MDAEGKLDAALPLYQRRVRATGTLADRLRYAKALMRAGQTAPAAKLFDDLLTEGQVMGGHDSRAAAAGLDASALLEQRDQAAALTKLQVLAGHDHRFIQPVTQMEHALKSGAGRAEAMSALEAVLESEDHSADFISKPLFASLRRTVDEHS